ncbi:MAG: response regulator [Candidatus Hydrogenedentes bacterium]|nr:response regulator [Candidatus Hydrogenedentota bacterium]
MIPLALVLVISFIAAREGQGNAVRQSLLTAAQTTTAGLRLASEARLRGIRKLSIDPLLVDALTPDASGAPRVENDTEIYDLLARHLEKQTTAGIQGEVPSVFRVYGADGRLLVSSSQVPLWAGDAPTWPHVVKEAVFLDLDNAPELQCYMAQTACPVHAPESRKVIGFVSELFDANSLLVFGLGFDPYRFSGPSGKVYQFFYQSRGRMVVSYLDQESDPGNPRLVKHPLDARLVDGLDDPGRGDAQALSLRGYRTAAGPLNVLIAYDRLFDNLPIYISVYRRASDVYAIIYRAASIAAACCFIGIAFLCINAYRKVHNDIVRPVLLLNEGAQIIGQGDLELKLKIRTGDEIAELASSFNKMALALKANIRQLEESEERYRSLVTSMRDGIFQCDTDGLIRFLNPAGVEVFGFDDAEHSLGQNLAEGFLEAADFERFTAELSEKGFVERSRVWMKRQDGRSICVELSGNLMHDDERNVIGVEGIFRDVTESVRLERAARERAERLSAISQIANVINSSLEAGRLYESLVVEVKKLVNFDYAELSLISDRGDAFLSRELWPEQHSPNPEGHRIDDEAYCSAWVAQRRECLIVDDFSQGEWPFAAQFPEGTRSCVSVPLYATGRIIGTLDLAARTPAAFSGHDVEVLEQMAPHVAVAIRNAQLLENLQVSLEEVTRAREKLHDANEELKTLDEMKTNLLSNVSHELRTPLVAVMGYTDMIINGKVGPVNEVQKDYLGISLRNIEKLVTLIENLLDFSRLHRGAETLVFSTFDLVDCARTSLQIVQPVADSRAITLELRAPEEEVLVDGDKGKLGQMFNNLLSNAVKFNRSGGTVVVEIRPTANSVAASVSDTGIGIPAEALDKVFTRFYQYDSSSTRKYGGTGIGLSIAQDIARLHGSRITVTSEKGKGSTFRFNLPLRVPRPEDEEIPDEAAQTAETHLLIELVTQDRALCNQIRSLLGPESMDVIHAVGAEHAIALARRHRPDCIILDLDPDRDGQALLIDPPEDDEVREVPVIVLTNDDDLYAQYQERAASRVKRGFRKSTLLSAIQYALHPGAEDHHPLGNRILCVDDDPEILVFMRRCLENAGFEVDQCRSGEEALERVATHEYGLVLLDIAMPGMDGWEACSRIKSDRALAGIKIFMVTAKPVDTEAPHVRQAKVDGYLMKPFKAEDLTELVQGCLSLRAAKDA